MSVEPVMAERESGSARGFSRGMGLINQMVGGTIFLGGFCLCCSLSFLIEPEGGVSWPGTVSGSTIVLFTTLVGCASLMAFGLGMQTDRGIRPASGAVVTCAVMLVLYVAALVGPVGGSHSLRLAVMTVVLGVITLVLGLLNILAWREVYANPPETTEAPTVRAEDFPDPWAETKEKYESPTREAVAKRKRKLQREIERIERIEKDLGASDGSDSPTDEKT